eukprot:656870-Lingulodinium_polyedra.AAC.1
MGWPCLMRTRLALGLAGLWHGGRDHEGLEDHRLRVADFLPATAADFDEFVVGPPESKPEKPPRVPTTFTDWVKRARRQNQCFGSVYGLEHKVIRDEALGRFEQMHEQEPEVFRAEHLYAWWEELCWRYVEEVSQLYTRLLYESGRETMRLEEVQQRALTPTAAGTAWLRLPNCFALDDPDGWFCKVILPRLERKHKRA